MKAEFLKIRSMPTPVWTAVAMLICFLGGAAATIAWGVGDEDIVLDVAIGLPTMIGSLVLGSWLAGVEFGQNTLRRVLSADPRRIRLVLVKLAVLLLVVLTATTLLMAAGYLIYSVTGSGHATRMDAGVAARIWGAALVTNITYAVAGFSLTLLTRSMAGGMAFTFAFFFVLDGMLSMIPKLGDFTIGIALSDVDLAIRGQSDGIFGSTATNDAWIASIVLAGWLVAFAVLGVMQMVRTEVR